MTPTEHVALSVVVPVFNGELFIARTVRELISTLARLPYSTELIVVDDGSSDATAGAVRLEISGAPIPVFLLRLDKNRGKGAAVTAGMHSARGTHRVFIDADLAYPPEAIADISAALEGGADIAIASRAHPDSRLLLNPSFFAYYFLRHFAGRAFNAVTRLLLLPGIADSQAGLKGFRAAAAERLFSGWLPRGFSFDLALLFRAQRLGLRLQQVPVFLRALDEPSSVRFLRDTVRMLRDLLLIRTRLVGDRFERLSRVAGRRWLQFASQARLRLRAPAAVPALVVGLASGLILLCVAKLGLRSALLPPAFWLAAIACLLLLAWRSDLANPTRRPRLFRIRGERLCFLAVLGLAAALRFVSLGNLPPMEHGDSAECGLQGLAILRGAAPDLFSFSDWYLTPYLSYVPYAGSFALFGVSMWSLRLPSAILGTAAVVPLYFLTRRWFGIRAAIFVSLLFATSHAAIHFSRIGLWNVQILFYEMCVFALVVAGLRQRSALRASAAGVISGVALYGYTAGRLIPVIVFAFLAFELARDSSRVRRIALAYAAGICVAIVPLLLDYYQNSDALLGDRTASVWVLAEANRHHVLATLGTNDSLRVLWAQITRSFQGFYSLGDSSSQYGTDQPLLSLPTALFALAGLGITVWRWREARCRFLLLWLGLGILLGSILVLDPPSYTRLLVLFPVPYLLTAVFLLAAVRRLRPLRPLRHAEVAAVFFLVALQSGAFNLVGYYRFNRDMGKVTREWDVLRVFDRIGDDYDYYLYTGPFLLADAPVFRLFSSGTRAVSAFTGTDLPELLTRDSVFVLTPEFRRVGVEISERFPGAEREVFDEAGVRQVIVYRCSRANGCRRGTS